MRLNRMNRRIYAILLMVFTLMGISNLTFAQITIMGQIKNAPDSAEVLITYWNNPVEITAITIGNDLLDEKGYFSFTYDLKTKKFGQFIVDDYYLEMYFVPGDTIKIEAEYHDYLKTFNIKSKVKYENEYLVNYESLEYEYKFKMLSEYPNAFLYKKQVDSVERMHQKYYYSYLKKFKDKEFAELAWQHIKYTYMFKRFYYGIKDFNFEIPLSYYDFVDSLDINAHQLVDFFRYNQCLDFYIRLKAFRNNAHILAKYDNSIKDKENVLSIEYNFIKQTFKGEVRDVTISDFVRNSLHDVKADTAYVNKILMDYFNVCSSNLYKNYIKDYYNRRKNIKNTLFPNIELKDIYNEKIYLHSLKGKFIYIDFWATWCYPCKLSMKSYPAFQEKYKSRRDIEYVFINVMDDESKWSSFVLNNPKYGLNFYADKNSTKKLTEYLELNAIPRYILIDKNLKIIDDDAPFPDKMEFPR